MAPKRKNRSVGQDKGQILHVKIYKLLEGQFNTFKKESMPLYQSQLRSVFEFAFKISQIFEISMT